MSTDQSIVAERDVADTRESIGATPARLAHMPILLLNVHEQCNCRCVMCDIWQRQNGREVDLADLQRQRESIEHLGVEQVVLTGGEPLMHRNFEALCEFLKSCGVRVTLLTTGLLLAKRAAAVADWIDEIIVSIDGPEEVHDRIRGVRGAYRLIGEGVEEVRYRKANMPVHGRSTVQKANHSVLRQTVHGAKFLSLDSISFLAADVTSQAFNRELVWPGERQNQIALTREEVGELENETELLIEEHSADLRSRYIVESAAKLRQIARRFREQLGELEPVAPACNAPWVSSVLEVDGSVRPCFFHKTVGSTQARSLYEVVNGEEAIKFRAALDVGTNAVCRRCVCSLNYSVVKTLSEGR